MGMCPVGGGAEATPSRGPGRHLSSVASRQMSPLKETQGVRGGSQEPVGGEEATQACPPSRDGVDSTPEAWPDRPCHIALPVLGSSIKTPFPPETRTLAKLHSCPAAQPRHSYSVSLFKASQTLQGSSFRELCSFQPEECGVDWNSKGLNCAGPPIHGLFFNKYTFSLPCDFSVTFSFLQLTLL